VNRETTGSGPPQPRKRSYATYSEPSLPTAGSPPVSESARFGPRFVNFDAPVATLKLSNAAPVSMSYAKSSSRPFARRSGALYAAGKGWKRVDQSRCPVDASIRMNELAVVLSGFAWKPPATRYTPSDASAASSMNDSSSEEGMTCADHVTCGDVGPTTRERPSRVEQFASMARGAPGSSAEGQGSEAFATTLQAATTSGLTPASAACPESSPDPWLNSVRAPHPGRTATKESASAAWVHSGITSS
jgi:hypothetical protein